MTPEQRIPHSFNRPSFVPDEKYSTLRPSHRRSRSEPKFGRHQDTARSLFAERLHIGLSETVHSSPHHFDPDVPRLAPAAAIPLRLKPQYSIRRPRPDSELFGVSSNFSPEIVLGEPKQHIGHPKTRIGQPVLKLAAIKERMELLEAANERLQHQIESNRTDAEMLSSSVTYFSSEYYAGLLTIRELRARSRQDAEVMSNQEQQLCQLKKFVGLMVEIGLHEPVLERAHVSVLKGENFEPALAEAIRNAAARPGSAWTGILDTVATTAPLSTLRDPFPETVQTELPADATELFEGRRQSTVDDLLKDLKDGNIPLGRHRSASQRFVGQSLARTRSIPNGGSLRLKTSKASKTLLSPPSPARCALRQLDGNRSVYSQVPDVQAGGSQTPMRRTPSSTPVKERRLEKLPRIVATGSTTSFSALASLQQLLDNFSSGSFGSLGTTTDETQSAGCDSLAEMAVYSAPLPAAKTKSPGRTYNRPCPEPASKGTSASTPSSANKVMELGRPSVSPVRSRRPSASGTLSRKSGWR
ncbi:hypothetical protein C8F04DRAFT_1066865 [Mycena alexandri]|uniref:Uncharacterized protein n=1 Tax=Mycena alexandri TaxID=1745969 RepID=A0AAD6TG58_9AGAR|nr:hypothetical protein C8F04DRAFT_1066865 [Mycena alexandri]